MQYSNATMASTTTSAVTQIDRPVYDLPVSFVNPAETVILIADDVQDNLNVVKALLSYKGFQVDTAKNGNQVLQQAAKRVPDLILLDIQMPEMDGIEACRSLKEQPQFRDVPVIFLTAKAESYDIVAGFKQGAVDYITKPFNIMELLARVQIHLELKRSRDVLAEKNRYLEVMSTGLTRLNHEKNEFMGIAAHDLKNPLTTIKGLADFLRQNGEVSPESVKVILENIIKSSERMFAIIRNLLDVNAIESGTFTFDPLPVDMEPVVRDIADQYGYQASKKSISIQVETDGQSYAMYGNADSITQVLDNLLSNAVKYSPLGKPVVLHITRTETHVCCAVSDEGEGLTESDKVRLFGKFTQLSARPTANEHSTGLGLFIAKKLVQAMNGEIWCESTPGNGATFFIQFPAVSLANIDENANVA
jgi:two-component system, sensor histidine kinase and response regulator